MLPQPFRKRGHPLVGANAGMFAPRGRRAQRTSTARGAFSSSSIGPTGRTATRASRSRTRTTRRAARAASPAQCVGAAARGPRLPATMRSMLDVLVVTFPFFALVLCGYVATRRGYLPLVAIPGLNTFVLYFALPCLLLRFGATTPIANSLNAGVVGVYFFCALIMVTFTVAVTLSHRVGWNDAAFGALVAAFPNTCLLYTSPSPRDG